MAQRSLDFSRDPKLNGVQYVDYSHLDLLMPRDSSAGAPPPAAGAATPAGPEPAVEGQPVAAVVGVPVARAVSAAEAVPGRAVVVAANPNEGGGTPGGPAGEEDKQEEEEQKTCVVHQVLAEDTLPGIMLKYGVTLRALKKANSFPGENFKMLRELVIPHPKRLPAPLTADQRFELARRKLQHEGRLSQQEAIAYLQLHDGDAEAALAQAMDDIAWEAEQLARSRRVVSFDVEAPPPGYTPRGPPTAAVRPVEVSA